MARFTDNYLEARRNFGVADDQQNTGWGEQAVNQLARAAISRLVDAEQLDITIKTSLKQITKGLIEAIAIVFEDVLIRENLRVQTLQMEIGEIRVKPASAMRGKIRLVKPSTGMLRIVIHQSQLTAFLNRQFQQRVFHEGASQALKVEQLECQFLESGVIAFDICRRFTDGQEFQESRLTIVPQIVTQGQAIDFEVQSTVTNQPLAALVMQLLTVLRSVLSLEDFTNRGTRFQFQQIDIAKGTIQVKTTALIDHFPT